MEKNKQTLNSRVADLEKEAADHERRITALEARLNLKPTERVSGTTVDEVLDEFLAGLSELDVERGME